VHGRYDELVGLLKQLDYELEPDIVHPRGRKLIFLGDLIDHGNRNADVLRLVMRAVDAGVALSVPGNHEARLVRWLRGNQVDRDGGMEATIAELTDASADFRQMLETFLDGSVSHYVLDRGNLVVAHAGLKESLQGRGSAAVRTFALHGEAPWEDEGAAPASTPAWVDDYQGAARVVYSHPTVAEAVWRNGTVNLDTGAAAPGGRITAVRYPEMQFVSAPVGAGMVAAAD
jgi:protein phosphatase